MKKSIYTLLFISGLSLTNNYLLSQNVFDDIFKNFDFDAFMREIEATQDTQEDAKMMQPQRPAPSGSPSSSTPTAEKSQRPAEEKKSNRPVEDLFVNPDTTTIKEKNTTVTKLTDESQKAYKSIIDELVMLLHKIKTDAALSPEHKDIIDAYESDVDSIIIVLKTLHEKKIYTPLLTTAQTQQKDAAQKKGDKAPSASTPSIAQQVIDILHKLRKLDQSLTQEHKKSAAIASDEQALKKAAAAKKPITPLTDKAIIDTKKRKSRGGAS